MIKIKIKIKIKIESRRWSGSGELDFPSLAASASSYPWRFGSKILDEWQTSLRDGWLPTQPGVKTPGYRHIVAPRRFPLVPKLERSKRAVAEHACRRGACVPSRSMRAVAEHACRRGASDPSRSDELQVAGGFNPRMIAKGDPSRSDVWSGSGFAPAPRGYAGTRPDGWINPTNIVRRIRFRAALTVR